MKIIQANASKEPDTDEHRRLEYERTLQELYEAAAIAEGLEDVKAGRLVDGPTALRAIEEKYGL